MKPLTHRVGVITGGARGIGARTARALAEAGATVVVSDLDAIGAEATAQHLRAQGHAACAIAADVGAPADVDALFAQISALYGRLDILVNNAGVARLAGFLDCPLDVWEATLRINLTGTFLCAQAAARMMIETIRSGAAATGAIVNIASISGQRGGTGRVAYGASKAGVIGLTKVMAVELAPYGIRVNAIAPGPIETDMARDVHTAETRAAYQRLVPQARYGSESDVANAVLFLAGGDSGYITGHILNVDGGFGAAGLMFNDLTQ